MISNEIHKKIPNFKCEICGNPLNKNKMKDLIIFAHGNIENDMQQHLAFKEITDTIYIHKHCMKLLINKKFSKVVRDFFNNSL